MNDISCRKTHFDIGKPPTTPLHWQTFIFHFHDFESLPSEKGSCVLSPEFAFCGHMWSLRFYPSGFDEESLNDQCSVFLEIHDREKKIAIDFSISIFDLNGKEVRIISTDNVFDENSPSGCGWHDYVERSYIMSSENQILNNGTLSIILKMRPKGILDRPIEPFVPSNTFQRNMSDLYLDEEYADVKFAIQHKRIKEDGEDEILDNPEFVCAHRLILRQCAPGLDAMLGDSYVSMTPVPIIGVDTSTFKVALKRVYGLPILYNEWKKHSRDLIDAADRFGLKNLKLESEAWFVKLTAITNENVDELRVYADSKKCYLLKEEVMKFFAKTSFPMLKGIFNEVRDVESAVTDGKDEGSSSSEEASRKICISSLRRQANDEGLDIDGSHETLIRRLKDHSKMKAKWEIKSVDNVSEI
ncbi:hypothetical protein ACHAXS_004459 [Conticribra weissflogii]